LGQEFTVIAGPEANLFMSLEGKNHISAREFRKDQNDELGVEDTIVSVNGKQHSDLRKLHGRGYSRSSLNGRYPELIGIVQNIAREWLSDERILVTSVMPRIIAEQLGAGVLNYPIGDYLDDVLIFVRTLVVETLAKTRPRSVMYSPPYRRAKQRSLELADKVIAAHRVRPIDGREPDLVDDLLSALAANKELMSEQELRVAVLGGYIGGLDTVSYTCCYMLYALLKHPEVLAQVTAEVDAAFASGAPTPSSLEKMEALHHAAMETLRMYPVAAAVQGTVSRPFEFAGYRVEQGQNLIVGTTVCHYLPEFFREPNNFDIHRFSKGRGEHRQAGAFAPYGLGEHICLGASMAELLIMLTMATLLRTVRLELDPLDYQLKVQFTPTLIPRDFYVRVVEQRS
jgi:cytochrome P450